MKRFFKLLVLTQPEQRLVIVLVLLMVAGAWYQHHRDASDPASLQPRPSASPTPQGAAISKSPAN